MITPGFLACGTRQRFRRSQPWTTTSFRTRTGTVHISDPTSVELIGVIGGSVLLIFAILQFVQASHKVDMDLKQLPDIWQERPGIILGVIFTAFNPFFIV